MFKNFDFGKYRGVVISVALFILLDASVLMLNFYLSFGISEDAASVNLAGRQRMLSQRMVKSLYGTDAEPTVAAQSYGELEKTLELFDQTLAAFDSGGFTTGASNDQVKLSAVSSDKARIAVDQAQEIWVPYKQHITSLLDTHRAGSSAEISQARAKALSYAEANNLALLKLMNDLTVELEYVASKKATTLRLIQTVGISLAIINFFIILFHFISQLRENDTKLDAARRETTEILDTVQEGLFLIDKDLQVGNQHSKQLEEIIGIRDIAGKNFISTLSDLVTPKDLNTAKKFIDILFDGRVVEKLISSLNPLEQIQVNIRRENGEFESRYLRFSFARVIEEDAIKHILVTVSDVTREIELQQQLEASQAESEQQFEMLTAFLHSNPHTLNQFLESTRESLRRANDILRTPLKKDIRSDQSLRAKAMALKTEIHRVKGDASALEFDGFATRAHEFESDLENLSNSPMLQGNDFLPLTIKLDRLFAYTDSVQQLAERLSAYQNSEPANSPVYNTNWDHLKKLATSLGQEHNKPVELLTIGLNEHQLSPEYEKLINSICVQLVRNSVVHGIETADERLDLRKSEIGRIEIRLAELSNKQLELSVSDDGRGIHFDRIRQQVVDAGIATEAEINAWDNRKLFSMIFRPEFSTADAISQDAGRGVGINVIIQDLKKVNGKLRAWTRTGGYTQFRIILPNLNDPATEAA